jgi:hypothetical protein
MAKIGNEELGQLTAEVLPERFVLAASPGGGGGLPLVGQLPIVGNLTQSLPLLGGGAGGAGGVGGAAAGGAADGATGG